MPANNMLPKIVIAGSLNMDFVVHVKRLPAPGETTLGSNFQMAPGGKGANQACAVGWLGQDSVNAIMAGRVGYDLFADHLKASLSAAGVDVSAVCATKSAATGAALIWVDASGQNSIVVASGANFAFTKTELTGQKNLFTDAKFALFQLESPLETVIEALKLARQSGARTILDPAPARELSSDILVNVDILTPNETEAQALLGRNASSISLADAPLVAEALLKKGSRAVVLKLGPQGCFYTDGQTSIHSPGLRVNAIDSTAAGDVFNGALAVALAEEKPIAEALRFANAAAAMSTTKAGAQSSLPRRSEVDSFLKSCAS
jgi:ribokinase